MSQNYIRGKTTPNSQTFSAQCNSRFMDKAKQPKCKISFAEKEIDNILVDKCGIQLLLKEHKLNRSNKENPTKLPPHIVTIFKKKSNNPILLKKGPNHTKRQIAYKRLPHSRRDAALIAQYRQERITPDYCMYDPKPITLDPSSPAGRHKLQMNPDSPVFIPTSKSSRFWNEPSAAQWISDVKPPNPPISYTAQSGMEMYSLGDTNPTVSIGETPVGPYVKTVSQDGKEHFTTHPQPAPVASPSIKSPDEPKKSWMASLGSYIPSPSIPISVNISEKSEKLLNKVSDQITHVTDTLTSSMNGLKSLIQRVLTDTSLPTWLGDKILLLIVSVMNLYSCSTNEQRILTILTFVLGLGIPFCDTIWKGASAFIRLLSRFFTSEKSDKVEYSSQGAKYEQDIAKDIHEATTTIATTFLPDYKSQIASVSYSFYNSVRSSFSLQSLGKKFSAIRNSALGIEIVVKYVRQFFGMVYEKIYGVPYVTDDTAGAVKEACAWMKKAAELVAHSKTNDQSPNLEFYQSVVAHYTIGVTTCETIQKNGYTHANFASFFKIFDTFKKLVEVAYSFIGMCKTRVVPTWLEFTGDPGVGKTTIVPDAAQRLYTAMMNYLGLEPQTDINAILYNDRPEDRFYDFYKGQPVISKDDYNQVDDAERRTDIYFNIINMIGSLPFALPCANMEIIGALNCNAKLLITTSNTISNNQWRIHKAHLEDMDALNRRRDFMVQVVLRSGCYTELPATEEGRVLRVPRKDLDLDIEDMYDFYLFNSLSKKRMNTKALKYSEVLNLVYTRMIQNLESFKKLNSPHKEKEIILQPMSQSQVDQLMYKTQAGRKHNGKDEATFIPIPSLPELDAEPTVVETKPDPKVPSSRVKLPPVKSSLLLDQKIIKDADKLYIYVTDQKKWMPYRPEIVPPEKLDSIQNDINIELKKFEEPERNQSYMSSLLIWILKGISLFLTLWSVYTIYRYFYPQTDMKAETAVVIDTGSAGAKPNLKTPVYRPNPAFRPQTGAVGAVPSQNIDGVIQKCTKNLVRVHVSGNVAFNGYRFCNGVSFGGKSINIPKHMLNTPPVIGPHGPYYNLFLRFWNKTHDLVTIHLGESGTYVVPCQNNDLVSISHPKFPEFGDIRKHITSDPLYGGANMTNIVVVGIPDIDPGEPYSCERRYSLNCKKLKEKKYYDDEFGNLYSNQETWAYDIPNENGLCFAMIFSCNPRVLTKFIGLHGAGNSTGNRALGIQVTRHFVDAIQQNVLKTAPAADIAVHMTAEAGLSEKLTSEPSKSASRWNLDDNNFEVLGFFNDKKLYHRMATESNIEPLDPRLRVFEPKKSPPNFRPYVNDAGITVRPIENSLNMFKNTPPHPDKILTRPEMEAYFQDMMNHCGNFVEWRQATDKETYMGVDAYDFFKRIDMKKAAGANFTELPKIPSSGKYYLFDINYDKYGVIVDMTPKPELQARIDTITESFRRGIYVESPAQVNPKDELVSARKIDLPRLFSTHELALNLIGRKYFAPLIENVLLSMDTMGITIGINPYDPAQWKWVLAGSPVDKPLPLVGDVAHADRDKDRELCEVVNKGICDFLARKGVLTNEDEWRIAYGCLASGTTDLTIIVEDMLLKCKGAHCSSGMFITGLLQSLYYKFAHVCAFISANKRIHMLSTEDRNKYLREICKAKVKIVNTITGYPPREVFDDRKHGDDFIDLVSEDYAWFTCHCLAYELSTFKVEITPAMKTAQFKDFYTKSEVDYLQRTWLEIDCRESAPLKLDIIKEPFNWVASDLIPFREYLKGNARWASLELALHPQETYEEVARQIDTLLERCDVQYRMPSYMSALWFLTHTVAKQNAFGLPDALEESTFSAQSGFECMNFSYTHRPEYSQEVIDSKIKRIVQQLHCREINNCIYTASKSQLTTNNNHFVKYVDAFRELDDVSLLQTFTISIDVRGMKWLVGGLCDPSWKPKIIYGQFIDFEHEGECPFAMPQLCYKRFLPLGEFSCPKQLYHFKNDLNNPPTLHVETLLFTDTSAIMDLTIYMGHDIMFTVDYKFIESGTRVPPDLAEQVFSAQSGTRKRNSRKDEVSDEEEPLPKKAKDIDSEPSYDLRIVGEALVALSHKVTHLENVIVQPPRIPNLIPKTYGELMKPNVYSTLSNVPLKFPYSAYTLFPDSKAFVAPVPVKPWKFGEHGEIYYRPLKDELTYKAHSGEWTLIFKTPDAWYYEYYMLGCHYIAQVKKKVTLHHPSKFGKPSAVDHEAWMILKHEKNTSSWVPIPSDLHSIREKIQGASLVFKNYVLPGCPVIKIPIPFAPEVKALFTKNDYVEKVG